jgi:NADH-quinone oxidoreductase subunit J
MSLVLFLVLALIAVAAAVGLVTARNPVHSALFLLLNFASLAIMYILLNAQFLAVVHIIVYTGAIMVLFLFVIMLMNLNKSTEPQKGMITRVAAALAGGLFLLTLLGATKQGVQVQTAAAFDPGAGLVKSVGHSLFTTFLLPFEVSSVLFLSAMIGAVLLGRNDRSPARSGA